jgi:hypothetical protein
MVIVIETEPSGPYSMLLFVMRLPKAREKMYSNIEDIFRFY